MTTTRYARNKFRKLLGAAAVAEDLGYPEVAKRRRQVAEDFAVKHGIAKRRLDDCEAIACESAAQQRECT